MSRIFVTGGAGYIGSHVCKQLVESGHEILVFDNLSKGHEWAVPKEAKFMKGDLSDIEILEKSLKKFNPDAVMHFAASIEADESMTDPGKFFQNNTVNTLNLLNICVKLNIKKFIFSSTAAVYGDPVKLPITEDHPLNPTNNYGFSKLFVEQILESYDKAHGLKFVALRYFNAAGASLDTSLGNAYEPVKALMQILMKCASGKRESFSIFGSDYDTKDGTCIRDLVHVVDVANAHILALDFLEKNEKSDIFNLGPGKPVSVLEVAEKVKQITGKEFGVIKADRRDGDIVESYADYSKAKEVLGWEPSHSDVDTIIKTSWDWEKKHYG